MTNQATQTSLNQKDITNQIISKDKEYKTRDGRKVEILTTSRDHTFNVVALIGGVIIEAHLSNGKKYDCESVSCIDLVEVQNIEEDLKHHDLVMVSDNNYDWYLRFFSHYEEEFGVFAFNNGCCEGSTVPWKYCRKATPQEIIENKEMLN